MANQPVPNTMQVDVIFLLFGQRVENVYHVEAATGIDAAALADCRDSFVSWVNERYMPHISESCSFIGLEVTNLSIPNGTKLSYQQTPPTDGGIAFQAEPGNVSFTLSARTGQTGRSFRGRTYVAGVPANKRTGNTVESAWADDLITAMGQLVTFLGAVNQALVVVSRIADNVERLIPLTTPVSVYTYTDLNIDSQRRRLTGRGT